MRGVYLEPDVSSIGFAVWRPCFIALRWNAEIKVSWSGCTGNIRDSSWWVKRKNASAVPDVVKRVADVREGKPLCFSVIIGADTILRIAATIASPPLLLVALMGLNQTPRPANPLIGSGGIALVSPCTGNVEVFILMNVQNCLLLDHGVASFREWFRACRFRPQCRDRGRDSRCRWAALGRQKVS